jgi:hypothetical protein
MSTIALSKMAKARSFFSSFVKLHILHALLGGREGSGKRQITAAEGVFWEHGYLGFLMPLRILNPVCPAYRGHTVTPNVGRLSSNGFKLLWMP